MKKFTSIIISLLIILGSVKTTRAGQDDYVPDYLILDNGNYSELDDPAFLQYIEDNFYANLESQFLESGIQYQIEDVNVVYISKEYLEEISYNTKANIFFGYTLDQINEVFGDKKYVFTVSDTGETAVQEFMEIPDDTYNRIVKNVLIGAGVILICVTVSILTAGAATPAAAAGGSSVSTILASSTITTAAKVHLIFTASAHTAANMAMAGTFFAGTTTMVARGYETGWDMDAMTKSAALNASEAFKWGAISGAVAGGGKEALRIHRTSKAIPTHREAELHAVKKYNGTDQVSYLAGEEVPYGTAGSTRPDVVVGREAIEVKCYDLRNRSSLYELRQTLTREITDRVSNLPKDMTQRIVLNVEGRGYSTAHVQNVTNWIKDFLEPVYHDIPIDIMGGTI